MTNKQEAKNWIKIAREFVEGRQSYTCLAVKAIFPEEAQSMMIRFWGDRDEFIPIEWNTDSLLGKGGKNVRSLYALFMALECDPTCLD